MPKTISSALETHLQGEVTSLATIWRLTRVDGIELFFTDLDKDLTYEGNTYRADTGYRRSAVANTATMSVDNLDIAGFLDSNEITEEDLRAGLYDYAEVRIALVNWKDLSQGLLKMRRGWLGEVVLTDKGFFKAELRGLTQVLSQSLGELYSAECRADLGDSRCKLPIDPDLRENSTAYALGDYVKVPTGSTLNATVAFLAQTIGEDSTDEITSNGATLGANAALQSTTKKFGSGCLELSPTSYSDTTAVAKWPSDASYDMSGQSFCIEGWVRFKSLSITTQVFASRYDHTVNDGWLIRRTFDNVNAYITTAGTSVNILAAVSWTVDTWYHIAFTHDIGTNTFRCFVDGTQVGSDVVNASATDDVAKELWLGNRPVSSSSRPTDGFLDEWRVTVGAPVYTTGFTPPSSPLTSDGNTAFLAHLNNKKPYDVIESNQAALGANGDIQDSEVKFAEALDLSPSSSTDTTSLAVFPDKAGYALGSSSFCIEGFLNFNAIPPAWTMGIAGHCDGTDGWFIRYNSGYIEFYGYTGGSPTVAIARAVTLVAGTWYHLAVTRDVASPSTLRIFIDGVLQGTADTGDTAPIVTPSEGLVLGGAGQSISNPRSFDGYLEEWRISIGQPRYTSNFAPPTEAFSINPLTGYYEDYANRIYKATTAGASDSSLPTFDTTPGQTTTDGTAVFTAQEAWTRNFEVTAVTDRAVFDISVDDSRAIDDWFNNGTLVWETGHNTGRAMEVRDFVQSNGRVTLFLPLGYDVQVGDKGWLYPGCDKRLVTCRDRFSNVINMRAEPYIPGQDEFLNYPDAS